eukprot:m.17184 g.17184  ORF g.17184 m.17184 type:complete len:352 (-) comp3217_c0_seq2:138-1193(-)
MDQHTSDIFAAWLWTGAIEDDVQLLDPGIAPEKDLSPIESLFMGTACFQRAREPAAAGEYLCSQWHRQNLVLTSKGPRMGELLEWAVHYFLHCARNGQHFGTVEMLVVESILQAHTAGDETFDTLILRDSAQAAHILLEALKADTEKAHARNDDDVYQSLISALAPLSAAVAPKVSESAAPSRASLADCTAFFCCHLSQQIGECKDDKYARVQILLFYSDALYLVEHSQRLFHRAAVAQARFPVYDDVTIATLFDDDHAVLAPSLVPSPSPEPSVLTRPEIRATLDRVWYKLGEEPITNLLALVQSEHPWLLTDCGREIDRAWMKEWFSHPACDVINELKVQRAAPSGCSI